MAAAYAPQAASGLGSLIFFTSVASPPGWVVGAAMVTIAAAGGVIYLLNDTDAERAKKEGGQETDMEKKYPHRGDGAGPDGGEHDRAGPRWYGDAGKKGEFIQPDRAGERAHGGGKQFKLFDKRGKKLGTYNGSGKRLRD